MHKINLKEFMALNFNDQTIYGEITHVMIWSPVHHYWIFPDDHSWNDLPLKEQKFLNKQKIVRIGFRKDTPNTIAVFLEDYGKVKNRQLYEKIKA